MTDAKISDERIAAILSLVGDRRIPPNTPCFWDEHDQVACTYDEIRAIIRDLAAAKERIASLTEALLDADTEVLRRAAHDYQDGAAYKWRDWACRACCQERIDVGEIFAMPDSVRDDFVCIKHRAKARAALEKT